MAGQGWEPPPTISRERMVELSSDVLARPRLAIDEREDVFRIEALGLEWDIGVMVYRPRGETHAAKAPDGRKLGFFLLHGGAADFRFMMPLARLLAGGFGYTVVSMTYPGRLNLDDPSRDWPGDTLASDGTPRTPIWLAGEHVAPDEVDVIKDTSLRHRYGTRIVARARPGTRFHDRMAAWPVAFEVGMKEACRRHLPEDSFAILVHGHSTGGPFVHMLSQRVPNIIGIAGIENSPFGYLYQRMAGIEWTGPFNDLQIRTWRDIARYHGAEAFHEEGGKALMRLPWLMEEVFDLWEANKAQPNFKAEYIVHYGCAPALTESAHVAARRLKLGAAETDTLVSRYLGFARELAGPDVKPVPPILLGIAKFSRDHRPETYENVVLPGFAAMHPAPKVRLVRFESGNHHYERAEPDLPMGLIPAVASHWDEAIKAGYFG